MDLREEFFIEISILNVNIVSMYQIKYDCCVTYAWTYVFMYVFAVYTYINLEKNYSGRESRNFYIYFPFGRNLILSVITQKNYFYEIISIFLLYLILVFLRYLLFVFINYMHFLLNHYSNFYIERIRN